MSTLSRRLIEEGCYLHFATFVQGLQSCTVAAVRFFLKSFNYLLYTLRVQRVVGLLSVLLDFLEMKHGRALAFGLVVRY